MIKLVTDSTADIAPALREAYDVQVVPLRVQFGAESFREGIDLDNDQFYTRLVQGDVFPTTSTPPVGAFVETYERLLTECDQIISIHISGKLSSTVQTARQAARMVIETHQATTGITPRIEVIDSLFASMIVTTMLQTAHQHIAADKPMDTVLAAIEDLRQRAFIYIGVDTLKFLERGGRIGHARAFLGTLLRVKPIVQVVNGEVTPVEQVRTTRRMHARLHELVHQQAPLQTLSIVYTTESSAAEALRDSLAATHVLKPAHIQVVQTGSVIGTHIGPGGIGMLGIRNHAPQA